MLSLFNLANAAALTAGSVLGGLLLGAFGSGEGAYAWLFFASCGVRLAIVALLRGDASKLGQAPATPLPSPLPVVLRTLAVRPASGALQRPLLAAPRRADERATAASVPPA